MTLLPKRRAPMGDKWAVITVGILMLVWMLLLANRVGYRSGYDQGARDEAVNYGGRVESSSPVAILGAPCNVQPNACPNGK